MDSAQKGKPAESFCNRISIPLVALVAIMLAAYLIAGPQGNFAINDDWIYGDAVKTWVESGACLIRGSNAFDFPPILLGKLLCSVQGFSFEHLRWLTFSVQVLGCIGLYLALRLLDLAKIDSALLTGLYAFNPLIMNLSLTFMTDVPALCFENWTLLAMINAYKRPSFFASLLCVLALTMCMATRQSGLFLLPIILVFSWFKLTKTTDKVLFLVSLLIPVLSYILLKEWLESACQITAGYQEFAKSLLSALKDPITHPRKNIVFAAESFLYIGLFVFPLTISLLIAFFSRMRKQLLLVFAISSILLLGLLLPGQFQGSLMPYSWCLFAPPIIGCYDLIGSVPLWQSSNLKLFTFVCDVLAIVAVSAIVMTFNFARSQKSNQTILLFSALGLSFLAVFVQLKVQNFDRYILLLLAPLILTMAMSCRTIVVLPIRVIFCLLTSILVLYGTLASADAMSFYRAKTEAINKIEARGISQKNIDGGSIYCLFHEGVRAVVLFDWQKRGWADNLRGHLSTRYLRWWPIDRDDFLVTTVPLKGFEVIDTTEYWSPLRMRKRSIYGLKVPR